MKLWPEQHISAAPNSPGAAHTSLPECCTHLLRVTFSQWAQKKSESRREQRAQREPLSNVCSSQCCAHTVSLRGSTLMWSHWEKARGMRDMSSAESWSVTTCSRTPVSGRHLQSYLYTADSSQPNLSTQTKDCYYCSVWRQNTNIWILQLFWSN